MKPVSVTPDDAVSSRPVPDTAASATIDCDLPCHRCGYNLRTLPRDGVCPECEATVRASLHFRERYGIDPAPARRIRRGLAVVLASVGAVIATILAVTFSGVVLSDGGSRALQIFLDVVLAVAAVGVWLSTGSTGRNRRPSRLGRAARVLFVLVLVQTIASEFVTGMAGPPPRRGEWLAWLRFWYFSVGMQTIPALAIVAYGLCLSGVAAVLPRRWLSAALAVVTAAFGLTLLAEPVLFGVLFASSGGAWSVPPWAMDSLRYVGQARAAAAIAWVLLVGVLLVVIPRR